VQHLKANSNIALAGAGGKRLLFLFEQAADLGTALEEAQGVDSNATNSAPSQFESDFSVDVYTGQPGDQTWGSYSRAVSCH
jgi:hypothetical protein